MILVPEKNLLYENVSTYTYSAIQVATSNLITKYVENSANMVRICRNFRESTKQLVKGCEATYYYFFLHVVFSDIVVLGRVRTEGPLHQNISLCLHQWGFQWGPFLACPHCFNAEGSCHRRHRSVLLNFVLAPHELSGIAPSSVPSTDPSWS